MERVDLVAFARALGSGLLLAVATSGGLVGERLSEGAAIPAALVNAAITAAAVLLLWSTLRTSDRDVSVSRRTLTAQAVGAVFGIALVHVVVRTQLASAAPWLSERPLQLVNDATAAGTTLLLVWACARKLDVRLLVVGLLVVTLYRFTGAHWHLDQSPHGFRTSVQQLVVMQFAACAIGLLVFTQVVRRRFSA